jgi:hypothetical protein
MRIAVCLVLLSGCVVVPSTHKTSRHVALEPSLQVRKGLARGLALETRAERGGVVVSAIRTRDCHRDVFDVIEVTEKRGLRMGGVEDPRGRAFGVILAPVTVPISALISGISVVLDGEDRQLVRAPHHVETTLCKEPAGNIAIDVELASGTHFTGHTDERGMLVFTIPKTEPARGVVIARAESQVAQLKYRRKAALAMRPESLEQ